MWVRAATPSILKVLIKCYEYTSNNWKPIILKSMVHIVHNPSFRRMTYRQSFVPPPVHTKVILLGSPPKLTSTAASSCLNFLFSSFCPNIFYCWSNSYIAPKRLNVWNPSVLKRFQSVKSRLKISVSICDKLHSLNVI